MAKILIFAPHPDDDVIGCGGSIINHVRAGNSVEVVYVTSGESGGFPASKRETLATREYEAQKAAKFMGVAQTHFLRQPDGYLSLCRENLIEVTALLRERQPDIVYIPPKNDLHYDHRVTHELVLECCVRAGMPRASECGPKLWPVGTILCYEINAALPEVNYIEDISAAIDQKMAALRLHKSQLRQLEYEEAVQAMNRLRGITSGRGAYCECFQIILAAKIFC